MSQFSMTPAWVLITGASAGIGEVFARRFAERGNHLILVARSADKLKALAHQLELVHNNRVITITSDLTERSAPKKILDEISRQGINLYGLVNNAGCGAEGRFVQVERERYLHMIDLNIRSLVEMTHLFLPGMVERKQGFILNVSSTASFQPLPYSSVYAATKAFVASFSEALWLETRETGVRVLNLCPGLTKTNFGTAMGSRDFRKDPFAQTPEQVVDTALKALQKNQPTVISGWQNRLLVFMERLMPHRFLLELILLFQKTRGRV